MENMFFNSWEDLLRVIIIGTLSYIALVFMLRVSGKRTLSKMNMFDFVITVALGSTFASLILSKQVALAEGVVALGLLISLQFIVAWFSIRSKLFQQVVKGEPSLLFYRGDYMHKVMLSERIAPEEIRSVARSKGFNSMETIGAIVLETDGTFTVIPNVDTGQNTALQNVNHYPSKEQPDNERQKAKDE